MDTQIQPAADNLLASRMAVEVAKVIPEFTSVIDFNKPDMHYIKTFRVKEGDKERVQAFEGVCIARRGGGVSETFTVRKISNGVGVERIFPIHSPMVAEIVVVRRGAVRRAKLYYLRNVTGKAARIKERKVVRAPRGA